MNWHIQIGFLAVGIVGCGGAVEAPPTIVETVTVKTFSGQEERVSLEALYDGETGAPAFASVLAVDREHDRQVFVSLDELQAESQADLRYLPVTESVMVGDALPSSE